MASKATVQMNAQKRHSTYLDMLNASELTIVHHEPGEDRCVEDVAEAAKRKNALAVGLAIACIDAEISGHSTLQMILHSGKIAKLASEREVIKTLLN